MTERRGMDEPLDVGRYPTYDHVLAVAGEGMQLKMLLPTGDLEDVKSEHDFNQLENVFGRSGKFFAVSPDEAPDDDDSETSEPSA